MHSSAGTFRGPYNPRPWWRVDLGSSYDVYQVIIVNRDQYQGNVYVSGYSSHTEITTLPVTAIHIELYSMNKAKYNPPIYFFENTIKTNTVYIIP